MSRTDDDLVERCRAGDMRAWADLYDANAGRLLGLLLRILANRAEAEDLLQEVFVVAYRRLDTFAGQAAVSTWLHRIAVNRALDHLRSRSAKLAAQSDPLEADGRELRVDPATDRVAAAVGRIDLERAIAELPDGYRMVFVLHDVEGLEHREISRMLDIAVGTSKSQLHKARLRLRERLRGDTIPAAVGAASAPR